MRTTVDLPEPLLRNAQRQAVQRGVTLSTVLTDALRAHLVSKPNKDLRPFKLITVKGSLVRPDMDLNRTSALIVEEDEEQYGQRR